MANAAIGWQNLSDAGTITATSFAPLMTPDRLKNHHVARKWRALTNTVSLIIDLGAMRTFNSVSLFGLNMTLGGNVRVRASVADTSGQDGSAYDSSALAGRVNPEFGAFVLCIPSQISARYVRIDLADAALSYMEAGRLVIMNLYTFAFNFSPGWTGQYIDRSRLSESRGGQTRVDADNKYRRREVTFEQITEWEKVNVIDVIDRRNGASVDVLMVFDPDASELGAEAIWGLLDPTALSQPTVAADGDGYVYSKTFAIKERL